MLPAAQATAGSAMDAPVLQASLPALQAMESRLRQDLDVNPNSTSTLYQLAFVLRQENRPNESLDVYTQAARQEKPSATQLWSAALNYVLLNDYSDAIRWLEIAASWEPRNVDILYSLGRCYYTEQRFADAERMFLRILEIAPGHLRAEENLGLTYDAENLPDKAEEMLRCVAEKAGKDSVDEWPFLNLGTFFLDHGHTADAIPFLKRAATMAPGCTTCHEKLGRALTADGRAREGVTELEAAAHLNPKDPKVHLELGRAYREAGEPEKSRAEFALSQSLYGQHSQN